MTRIIAILISLIITAAYAMETNGAPPGSLTIPQSLTTAEAARIAAMARASQATIAIFGAGDTAGGGSGVILTPDGYAVTNFHVAQPSGQHMKCGLPDGRVYDAVIVSLDPTGDVALIKLLGRDDFPIATLGDSQSLRVGQMCFAAGNPFLLATDFQPTITFGVISGIHRYQYPSGTILEYTDCIQTDAAINPGNSGGPLFDAQGQLIGINGRCSFEKRGRVNVGVGYAISIQQVMQFLGSLRSGRIVDHATLGATVATDERGAVVVTNILESSDAYRRGLRYGDQLVELDGRRIDNANTLKNILGTFPEGWRIPLVYRRDGKTQAIVVRLARLHSPEELVKLAGMGLEPPQPERPKPPTPPRDRPAEETPPAEPSTPPGDRRRPKSMIPAHIQSLLELRHGYANYHFNRLETQRVWNALRQQTAVDDRRGSWTLEGELAGGGSLRVVLDDRQGFAQWTSPQDRNEWVANLEQDLAEQMQPTGSGGFYVALHLWRRLLVLGPSKFGEVTYWGTAPWQDRQTLCDVYVAIHDALETRFYFDPTSGLLVGLEMFRDSDQDPCEVSFGGYQAIDGQQLPQQIAVRFGDLLFAEWKLTSITLDRAVEEIK